MMLSFINHQLAIDCIVELSDDSSAIVRRWVNLSLGCYAEDGVLNLEDVLWKGVNDSNNDVKWSAILGLAKIKDKRVKPIIIQHLEIQSFHDELFESIECLQDFSFIEIQRCFYLKYQYAVHQKNNFKVLNGFIM